MTLPAAPLSDHPTTRIDLPPGIATADGRLLKAWDDDALALEWDLLFRYGLVARLLDRMLDRVATPVHILEVGCNIHNVLPSLLNPRLVRIKRCDIEAVTKDEDFFVIPTEPPWPIEDGAYDAVVALEVLEHLPRERRRPFLAECLRVARHGAIVTCPNAAAAVGAAEAVAAAAYRQRHSCEHAFLQEHDEQGLPAEDEIRGWLREMDCPHAVLESSPVDAWLALLVLAENLKERQALPEIQQRLNALALRNPQSGSPVGYRKIYICAKSFDATAALEPLPELTLAPSVPPETPVAAAALQHLAVTTCDAMNALLTEYHGQVAALRDEQQKQHARFQDQIASLLDDHRTDVRVLQEQLVAAEDVSLNYRQQTLVFRSFVQALLNSKPWKLLSPLRSLRRVLRPRGFDASALVPWQQLDRDHEAGPGHWIATGNDAHFLVPCALPAGPLHVRLKMSSDVPGQMALYADHGTGTTGAQLLEETWVCGPVDRDFVVNLVQDSLAFRFDPLDVPGRFHIEALQVTPISPAVTLLRSWRERLTGKPASGGRQPPNGTASLEARSHQGADAPRSPSAGEDNHVSASAETQLERPLNIVYVLRTAGLCGGVKVVLEHASRLCARGHNALIYCLDADTAWFEREVPVRAFGDVAILKQALAQFRGIKVATWHETAPWVAESLQPGDRGYYLVQDIEESYSRSPEEAAEVLQTYGLGLKALTESTWVRDQLKERFQLDSVFHSIGLDLDLFQPRPATRDPNLILTQARTWSGGGAAGRRLKGWDTARTTVLRCRLLNPRTSLMTFSMEDRPSFPPDLPHVHFRLPSDEQLAQLYSRAGLYLLTSTHEGFGLTAAEAMACGCPVVATRAHGNEEFCIDGVTALLAPPGDVEQLTQQCLRLQSDPQLARELGESGRRFILNYSWERVVDRLEQEFLQRPGPEIVIDAPRPASSAPVAVSIDSEYPDLQLDEPPAVDWSIVIPTVNDAEMAARCIASCREHAGENASLEFIVVDDGTRDRAVREALRRLSHEMDFRLLFNHQNLGFSATVNHGMRQARGRFVMLCNNDVLFFQPWRDGLTRFFEDPHLGIAGVRLLYPNRTIQHAGMDKVPGQLRFHHTYGHQLGDHTAAVCNRFVWSVTGALLVIRRETLQQLGGFSSAYGTAWEDVDYCLHAWAHGVRVGYCGEVAAFHLEGGTRGATPAQKSARPLLWAERERSGSVYFNRKWESVRNVESFEALLPASKRAQLATTHVAEGLELVAR